MECGWMSGLEPRWMCHLAPGCCISGPAPCCCPASWWCPAPWWKSHLDFARYRKILEARKSADTKPKAPQITSPRINQQEYVEGLLSYYDLPCETSVVGFTRARWPLNPKFLLHHGMPSYDGLPVTHELPLSSPPSALDEEVDFVLRTLPVNAKNIGDGDGMTVYVDTAHIPAQVQQAAIIRNQARAANNFLKADKLRRFINQKGYGFWNDANGKEILAKRFRIRLKGVDAPECEMPYGEEAKDELTKLVNGKCLEVKVYYSDKFGRSVGDVYCNGIFVQEYLLKRGSVFHYATFDRRPEFVRWESEAWAACLGVWSSPNPERPWIWRKRNPGWRENTRAPVEACR